MYAPGFIVNKSMTEVLEGHRIINNVPIGALCDLGRSANDGEGLPRPRLKRLPVSVLPPRPSTSSDRQEVKKA